MLLEKISVISPTAALKLISIIIINEIIPLKYWAAVTHQCTCIYLFPHNLMMPMMGAVEAQARSEYLAGKIADDVKNNVVTRKKLGKALINKAEHSVWPTLVRMKAQDLKANDNCIMCGTCAKVCPMGNIKYTGKAVIFGDKCISCMACVQYCPKEAINVGKVTEKRERYHNVNITVDDLNQEIISF